MLRLRAVLFGCLAVVLIAPAGSTDAAPAPPEVPARMAATPVTVGAVSGNIATGTCGAALAVVQTSWSAGITYDVPSNGVATSVSYNANGVGGQIRAVFFVPGALADHWTVTGKTDPLTITPGVRNTFPVRLPVQQGWRLGIHVAAAGMNCSASTASAVDQSRADVFDPATSSDFGPGFLSMANRVNLAVVVEPDADGDLHGDVSQDLCPQSSATQAACTPDTAVTKAPKKRTTKRRAKVAFTSTLPGSTFTCAVDGKAAQPCTSPFTKRFGYGKHSVAVTAIGPVGVADPTPATVKFKVKRPA